MCSTVMALTLGFFLREGIHGLYMDDYSVKLWAFSFVGNKWKPNLVPFAFYWRLRPLAYILAPNIVNAIPEHEFIVRLGIVAMHLFNVVLLASLVRRVTASMLVSTLSAAYFIFPVFGNEGLLWFTAAVTDVFCLFFLLLGFHCLLDCRSLFLDKSLFVCGLLVWFLMIMFYESGLFTLLLLPAFVGLIRRERLSESYKVMGIILVVLGVYLALVERSAPNVLSRGGPTLNLVFILFHRVPQVAERLWWLLADWGIRGPLRESFELGWREWMGVPYGRILILTSFVGLCLVGLLFPVRCEITPAQSRLLKLAFIGCAWTALGLVPIILVKSQIVEVRTLYVPSVGFALAMAALSTSVVSLFHQRRRFALRAVVLIGGVWVCLSSLTMAGLVRTYELRWNLDQSQVAALQPIISSIPATQQLWLLPVGLDERSVSTSLGRHTTLDSYLFGVFETPWSTADAIRLRFGDRNVHGITTNRWVPLRVNSVRRSNEGEIRAVTIQNEDVPVQRLIAFTYQSGFLVLLSPLEIHTPHAAQPIRIDLPLVHEVAQLGVPMQAVDFKLEPNGNF